MAFALANRSLGVATKVRPCAGAHRRLLVAAVNRGRGLHRRRFSFRRRPLCFAFGLRREQKKLDDDEHLSPRRAITLLVSGSPYLRDLTHGRADLPELKGGPGTTGRGRWHGGISRTKSSFLQSEREKEKLDPLFVRPMRGGSDIFFPPRFLASAEPFWSSFTAAIFPQLSPFWSPAPNRRTESAKC